jgi:uncharacterized SAM-binding protein YcdF (DUF218 family)
VLGWLLAYGAARLLVVQVPMERADAILILSGSSRIIERTKLAAQLFREGRAPRIILTNDNQLLGWDAKEQRNLLSYQWSRKILVGDGIPVDKIEVVIEPVAGTYEELMAVEHYATQHGLHSLLIVTSAYHSRRTLWTAGRLFKGVQLGVGLEHPGPVPSPWFWWLRRSGWRLVAGEYVKMAYYSRRF